MLSDVYRCLGFQLAHVLFKAVPGCVLVFARASLCVWVVAVGCLCVWSASWLPSLTLVLGECQGCLWLSPPVWAPSAGPGGQLSLGIFAGSWSSAGLWARRSEVGEEGEDQASSQGAGTRLVQDQGCLRGGRSFKTGVGGKEEPFCLEDNRYAHTFTC